MAFLFSELLDIGTTIGLSGCLDNDWYLIETISINFWIKDAPITAAEQERYFSILILEKLLTVK